MKFLGVIKTWVVAHKVAAIAIAAGATAVIATSVIVPVAVSNAKVEITWKNEDGSVLRVDKVKKGQIPSYGEEDPTKASTAQFAYSFAGWEPALVEAKENAEYTAKFSSETRKYTVTWKNDNGDVLETDENVPYGSTPEYNGSTPTKASSAQYDYGYSGWDQAIHTVEGNQIYTAQYNNTTRSYTIKFKDDLGNELKSEVLEYGATPTAPANPLPDDTVEWDYISFDSWDHAISAVSGEDTYIGVYTKEKQKYTVTWNNWDDSELEVDENVPYGTVPTYDGDTPTKAKTAQYTYTFSGWDNDATVAITGDITFTAQFGSEVNKYKVTWLNPDGEVLEEDIVNYGDTPSYDGDTPTYSVAHYSACNFSGWDSDTTSAITGTKNFVAQYTMTPEKYTAKFYNYDRTTLLQTIENVDYDADCRSSYTEATPTRATDGVSTFTFAKFKELPIDHANKIRSFVAEYAISTPLDYFNIVENSTDCVIKGFASEKYTDNIGIPSEYNSKPITVVYDEAFKGKDITAVYIPNTITSLYDSAFRDCSKLKTVTFQEGGSGRLSVSYSVFNGAPVDGVFEFPLRMSTGNWINYSLQNMKYVTAFTIQGQTSTSTYNFCEDGVFYSNYGKTLVAYPSGKTDSRFVVRSSVTGVSEYACINNEYLTEINFTTNSGTLYLRTYFCRTPNLEKVTFNLDCTLQLYWYPFVGGKLTTLILPKTVLKARALSNIAASESKPVNVFISSNSTEGWKTTGGDWDMEWYYDLNEYVHVYLLSEDEAIAEGDLPSHVAGSWHYVNGVPTVWEV